MILKFTMAGIPTAVDMSKAIAMRWRPEMQVTQVAVGESLEVSVPLPFDVAHTLWLETKKHFQLCPCFDLDDEKSAVPDRACLTIAPDTYRAVYRAHAAKVVAAKSGQTEEAPLQ